MRYPGNYRGPENLLFKIPLSPEKLVVFSVPSTGLHSARAHGRVQDKFHDIDITSVFYGFIEDVVPKLFTLPNLIPRNS